MMWVELIQSVRKKPSEQKLRFTGEKGILPWDLSLGSSLLTWRLSSPHRLVTQSLKEISLSVMDGSADR